jgi:pre-rRNA-processing protein TSR4
MTIQLAFIGQPESLPQLVTSVNELPNKVGGVPIWLDFLNPLEQVECRRCNNQMPLLLQLYAPEDYPPNAFHRVVYVFCCKNGSCRSITAFRSQLELNNDLYSIEGDVKLESELKSDVVEKWISSYPFPEMILEEEEEPGKSAEEVSEELANSLNIIEEGDDDLALEDETETEVDKQFLKFQKRIARAPEQVLRYGRTNPDGENEEPLWVSDIGKDPKVSSCPHCGAHRTFEFQVITINIDYSTIIVFFRIG